MTGWPLLELTVMLPLAGLLLALSMGRHAPSLVLWLGPLILLAAALLCSEIYVSGQPVERFVGGWEVPLGIALRADGLAATFLLTTATIALAVAAHACKSFGGPRETARSYTFWPLFYALWASLNAIFIGGDLFNLYVALELLTLSAVAMVAYGNVAAAVRYMLFALAGSLAYLLGVVLLYSAHGTLDIRLLGTFATTEPAALIAVGLMTAGLLAKTALFPFHAWLPPAHGDAPTPASALLSALVVKASFFIIVRIWFEVVPGSASTQFTTMLGLFGAGAVLYGSVLAIRQERLKLIVAYSTVAQLGYLFFIFPLAASAEAPWAAAAWSGGMFHAIAHAFAKAAMFLAAGLMIEAVGHDRLKGLVGLGRALPMTVFAFGIAAVSIMGLPPSGGFMGKYLMLTSALAGGHVFLAVVMIVGGLLAAIYLFRPLALTLSGKEVPEVAPIPWRRQAVPLLLALAAVALGIASALPYSLLQIGRFGFTGGAP